MPTSLRDKVVLITGAASGLGRQLALELAREGAAIAAIDLQAGPLQVLCEEMGSRRAGWAVADVGDGTGLSATVNALERALGPVDVLIANAGVGTETPALAFCPGDLERQVRVNLLGVANSIGAVLPGMLRRGRGQLVAISSLASYRGMPRGAGYCASKAGVNALMDSLRVELRPHGIACTTVCPGWIRTPLARQSSLRKRGVLDVDRAARRVLTAVRRRRPFAAFPLAPRLAVALMRWLPVPLGDALAGWSLGRKGRGSAPAAAAAPERALATARQT
jgi:NAD(P)-dependent dehydrogenase (short-subunit alcohol dehydrogenase family)